MSDGYSRISRLSSLRDTERQIKCIYLQVIVPGSNATMVAVLEVDTSKILDFVLTQRAHDVKMTSY